MGRPVRHQRLYLLAVALVVVAAACGGPAAGGSVGPGGGASGASAPNTGPSAPAPSWGGDAAASAPADPAPTPTPTPLPSPTPAPTPIPLEPFGFEAKGMTHEVIAFATVDQLDYVASSADLDAVSTVAFFGLTATSGGAISGSNEGAAAWRSPAMDRLIARAHAEGTKVVATLGRFSWTAAETRTSATLLGSATARARLARTVADAVVARGVDGVNVDFEPIPAGQAGEYSDLVSRIRHELDARRPGLQLTVDLVGHFDSYDVPGLVAAGPDALYLMGYHYAGWWSTVAGSTAPLGGPRYDLADTVRALRKWVPANRLIVGIPYYGHLWPTASGAVHAATTGRGSDLRQPSAAALAAAHGIRYDAAEQVAWSAWQVRDCAGCALHWVQVYFDDVRAIEAKYDWIRTQTLLGTGIWTLGFEGSPGPLDDALRKAFLRPAQ